MEKIKPSYVSTGRRPFGACAPLAVMFLAAYAAFESKNSVAQETDTHAAKPMVFVVAMVDPSAQDRPASRPISVSDVQPTVYAVAAVPRENERVVSDADPDIVRKAADQSARETGDVANANGEPVQQPEQKLAQATTGEPTTPMPPPAATAPQSAPGQNPQPANTQSTDQEGAQGAAPGSNDELRRQVFGLAQSGGAVRALDEAKQRPDVFSPVDIAQLQELTIRQLVRGGRDKVRAMSSSDRFDTLDEAIKEAMAFDDSLPKTPDYAPVRSALAGDLTVAYSARGRMKDAVAAYESIPADTPVATEALAAVGEAYSYLQEPKQAEQVYRKAIEQATSKNPNTAARGYQYGTHTRLIDLREGLFYALTDQNKYGEAWQDLEQMRSELPPAAEIHPWDLANDDYMRYYRLVAQYQIYIGQTSTGLASLDRLREQVPFSAEVRNVEADTMLGMSRPRRAREIYNATLTDHPDNIEALAGLGRTSLQLDNFQDAGRINDAFGNTFPENAAVRNFQRDYQAYRAPVLNIEVNGEHGNSALADNEFSIETQVYSPPVYGNWRVFADTFYGHANTDIGNISRTRVGLGGDYRSGSLNLTAQATRSLGSDSRTGGNGELTYTFNDYLSANASVDSDTNQLPWKAYLEHIWGKTASVGFNVTDTDRRSGGVSYTATRFSDSNFNQQITASATQRVLTLPNQSVNLSVNLNTSSNTKTNTPYYAPSRDYTGELVAMHQWGLWRSGERSLVQRIYVNVGAYNERGFGTSVEGGARIEHAWTFSHDVTLTYGLGVLNHAYDGVHETSLTAYAALAAPF